MEQIAEMIQKLAPLGMKERFERNTSHDQLKVDYYNSLPGCLKYYDCPKCKNKGTIAHLNDDGIETHSTCECMKIRRSYELIEKSGLKRQIDTMTFDNFTVSDVWQQTMKATAQRYACNPAGWLYLAGQSGCGKTHLCTAVCGKLLHEGREVLYITWRHILQKLQANRFDEVEYENILQELAKVDVLYIDDFLKSDKPDKEMSVAFEIIDARYISKLPTIISSEMQIKAIQKIDEAVAGRISEMARGNIAQILNIEGRNYRLRREAV